MWSCHNVNKPQDMDIYGNSHGRKFKNKMLASVMTKDVSSKQERSERNKAEKKILRFKSRLVPCQAQTTDTGLSQGFS